jgi:hypothetical protein
MKQSLIELTPSISTCPRRPEDDVGGGARGPSHDVPNGYKGHYA